MIRYDRVLLLFTTLGAFGCASRPPASVPDTSAKYQQSTVPSEESVLTRRLSELNYIDAPLADILEEIGKEANLSLDVHWNTLNAANITRSTPVTLLLRDATVSKALSTALSDAGGGDCHLIWFAEENGTVLITTATEFVQTHTLTVEYDVKDLVDDPDAAKRAQNVKDLIQSLEIGPDYPNREPDELGRAAGYGAREKHGVLTVTQSAIVHKRIPRILQKMREERVSQTLDTPETRLRQRELNVTFNSVPLCDALSKLGTSWGVVIKVDWNVLAKSGVAKARPVTVHLMTIRRSRALKQILEHAGNGAGLKGSDVELTYYIDSHRQIIVTTFDAYVAAYQSVRKYNIADLFPIPVNKNEWPERAAAVIALIEETIDPPHWKDAGGSFTITFRDGWLTVCATPDIHREMDNLLQQLRERDASQQ